MHFPEYGEDYFRQLTAEQLVAEKTRGGFVRLEWALIPGRENHVLDCRVYARAAASVLGLDRFRESDWLALERATGQTPAPASPTPEEAKREVPVPVPPVASQPARAPWLPRRPSGWLRK